MRQSIYLLLTGIFLLLQLNGAAQRDKDNGKERWEKYRAEKVSFLTDKLSLTPEEAQKFWPVYNQLDKDRWAAQRMRREMEHELKETEDQVSNREAKELTRKFAGSLLTEANLLVDFNEKFLEILPPRKVLQLYKAENEFRSYMIKKYRDRRKNGDNHP